ncbi:uncharacterized protein LOC114521830 [Dendronephthya gigantea]|uniref:uncharacterized protein LOC114521830 n=1 Tax=Dendronephthya gigantea TaxID=151771 RepID=UPI00106A7893|nr:uncharacterized protein LOC114521830 [Dendronephthya gigantea]
MANFLFRQFRLARRLQPVLERNKRCMSLFTKEREPPNGFLFNEKPRLNGEKREWEDWEAIWYRWWIVSILILGIGFYYRPDTSLGTWAREEALRQIEEKEAAESSK